MKVIVTGAAGFIGFHLCQKLLVTGHVVIGVDNLSDYYDVNLKRDRLKQIENNSNFTFHKLDITDKKSMSDLFNNVNAQCVVHLAAQAGVRYSLENPVAYIDSNIHGFINILENCRHNNIEHLVYASSSSVYGANTGMPFSVHDNVDHPLSLYGATKKSNELMAHSYSYLYGLPTTGLRFFTVYGPWGRPDMSYFKFTKNIYEDLPIDVYNNGEHQRDFTYIDDIVEGVVRIIDLTPQPNKAWSGENPDPGTSYAPYHLYNLGNNNPVQLMHFIKVIEDCVGKEAKKNFLPMQAGDMLETYADIDDLNKDIGYSPSTNIETGIARFVEWYKKYYGVN